MIYIETAYLRRLVVAAYQPGNAVTILVIIELENDINIMIIYDNYYVRSMMILLQSCTDES